MDNRTLIALGMLIVLVIVALLKGQVDEHAIKEIVLVLGGGIIGVALPQRPKSGGPGGPPPGPVLLILAASLLLLVGCATSEPYAGPVGPPTITGDEWFWPHGIDQRWVRETTLHVSNSQPTQLDAVLDCESGFRHARKWPGSRFTLHVPPMTVQHVLIDPHDHVCSLLPVEAP